MNEGRIRTRIAAMKEKERQKLHSGRVGGALCVCVCISLDRRRRRHRNNARHSYSTAHSSILSLSLSATMSFSPSLSVCCCRRRCCCIYLSTFLCECATRSLGCNNKGVLLLHIGEGGEEEEDEAGRCSGEHACIPPRPLPGSFNPPTHHHTISLACFFFFFFLCTAQLAVVHKKLN